MNCKMTVVVAILLLATVNVHAEELTDTEVQTLKFVAQERTAEAIYGGAPAYNPASDPALLKSPEEYMAEMRDAESMRSLDAAARFQHEQD